MFFNAVQTHEGPGVAKDDHFTMSGLRAYHVSRQSGSKTCKRHFPEDVIQLQVSVRSLIDRQSPLCQCLQMSWAGENTRLSVR